MKHKFKYEICFRYGKWVVKCFGKTIKVFEDRNDAHDYVQSALYADQQV